MHVITNTIPRPYRDWQRRLVVLLGATAFSSVLVAAPAAEPISGELPALLTYAERHSPRLAGMAAEVTAARARVDGANALADPMLRIESEDALDGGLELSPARSGRTRYQLMQDFPWAGKRGLRRDIAVAEADGGAAGFRRERSELRREIRVAHADWHEAEARMRILEEMEAILANAEAAARARYAAGLALQGDVLRAQLELTGVANERLALVARSRAARARLNGLIGRRQDAELTPPASEVIEPLPALAPAESRLADSAPEIEAAAALERAAGIRDALTRRERWPDLRVGVMAMQRGNQIDEWGLMLELNLPFRQARRRADEAESAAMRDAAHALREEAIVSALAGLRRAHAEASGALAQRELAAGTLEVQAGLTLDAALAAYGAGTVDFLGVIDATLQLRRARIATLTATASYRRRLAEFLDYLGES